MKRELFKGTIVGLRPNKKTGIAVLEINDDRHGEILVPCYGRPTVDAFAEAFPGTIVDGYFINDAIVNEVIFYRLDELGILEEFTDADRAPIEMIEEYEATAKKESAHRKYGGPGTSTDLGLLPPEDPVYSRGPIVAGREIQKKTPSKPGTHTRGGFLPPDHWLLSSGPIVGGRPIFGPKKKFTEDN